MDALRPFVRVLEAHAQRRDDGSASANVSWRCQTLALWKYREGRYEDAMIWAERALADGERPLCRSASARLIRAMAQWRIKQTDETRSEFETARGEIRSRLETPLNVYDPDGGFWFDWVVCDILLNEAARLFEGSSQKFR
jgi:hypothetical protein